MLFNRFYQPDIDLEQLEVVPRLHLSSPAELLLRLRWLGDPVRPRPRVAGGDRRRPHGRGRGQGGDGRRRTPCRWSRRCCGTARSTCWRVRETSRAWMEEHEYESLRQMQGSMSLVRCPDPRAFERGNYMRVLQTWRRDEAPMREPRH